MLARYAPSGNKTLLTDALMSVIAQANDSQGIDNFYAYSPYGEVQTLGPDGGNSLQYTGRENDGTGLYYYRARYYDPVLKRFVSEDPIGIRGGLNLYGYVGGDSVSLTDPMGNDPKLLTVVIVVATITMYTDVAKTIIDLITPVQNMQNTIDKNSTPITPSDKGGADFDPKTGIPYGLIEQRQNRDNFKAVTRDLFAVGKGATDLISPSPASLIKDIAKICR